MTNYTTFRVTELKDLLSKRKLPTNGKKEELIARLEAADREAAAAAATPTAAAAAPAEATSAAQHLPSAEEYEINWDEDDTTATGSKSTKPAAAAPAKQEASDLKKVVVASASAVTSTGTEQPKTVGTRGEKKTGEAQSPATAAASTDGKKPFAFKRLADQFADLPSNKKPDTKKKPDAPKATATTTTKPASTDKKPEPAKSEVGAEAEDKPAAAAAAAVPEPSFAAGLAPTPLEVELEKRKARAARFGAEQVDPKAAESLKKLERAARFGTATGASGAAGENVGVKGLDQALPERKPKRPSDHNVSSGGGRGGVQKRARYGDRGQRRHGGGGGNGGDRRNGGTQRRGDGQTSKNVLDDPTEKEKAEKRRNRFGA